MTYIILLYSRVVHSRITVTDYEHKMIGTVSECNFGLSEKLYTNMAMLNF